jgi:hypothetical protein
MTLQDQHVGMPCTAQDAGRVAAEPLPSSRLSPVVRNRVRAGQLSTTRSASSPVKASSAMTSRSVSSSKR